MRDASENSAIDAEVKCTNMMKTMGLKLALPDLGMKQCLD